MIAPPLASEQQRAVDASFEDCIAIVGAPGTGKTSTLNARVARARALDPHVEPLTFSGDDGLGALAASVLASAGKPVTLIDDVEAETLFADACAPLFALDWEELTSRQLDPEVPALRSPARFLDAAFRLIRKLRDARVEPHEFLSRSLSGATEFYAKPPNFADPALLTAIKDVYHDSLAVTPAELQRQYRREIDLAKILTKLYERYCEQVEESRRMTERDAVDAAVRALRAGAALQSALLAAHRFAFVDDAHERTAGEMHLLQAIFGTALAGVTFASEQAPPVAAERFALHEQHRSPRALELACRRLISREPIAAHDVETRLFLHRAASVPAEAAFIAARVREWLDAGMPANRIAVIFRSVRNVEPYEAALLDRDVPIVSAGDLNVFADRRALDALALLWNAYDPFRHDWLLRTLGNPAFGLSDASLATLCAEPPNPQRPLFVLDDEPAPTVRASRWDPKRDLRLGWNVVSGEQDAALSEIARERIVRFRALRQTWIESMRALPFESFARAVWRDGLSREGTPGSARERAQRLVLQRLLARLSSFSAANPDATLEAVLAYAERRASSDLESCEDAGDDDGVRVLSIEAARGREFDRVVVADVRAGAFPRWYVPDAFLFSPRLGMIPKENAGDARASRTAKFSYYTYRNKSREHYNERERRAFVYALRRARVSALVTASGPPTKGITAPEFLEELKSAHLPGSGVLP